MNSSQPVPSDPAVTPTASLEQPSRKRIDWRLTGLLLALYFSLRLPALLALPIFCDEAIYLRYGQLVAQAPWANAFVSLVDPKPPLHFWLLAAIFPLFSDPLFSGRLLSVLAGAASLPFLLLLCRELALSLRGSVHETQDAAGESFPVLAGLLFVTCPFLAFYQRLALAESLLILEILASVWLALRMARASEWLSFRAGLLTHALPFGLTVGLAMLTKQNTSYVLWALPLLAAALRFRGGVTDGSRSGRVLLAWSGAALLVGILLWCPVLLPRHGAGLVDRIFFRTSHALVGDILDYLKLSGDNLLYVFVPTKIYDVPYSAHYSGLSAPADAGWLWLYLTPPVHLLGLCGLLLMALRREWRLLGFLSGWLFLMLLPFVPVSTTAFSRYALPAVPPMLLAAALLLGRAVRGARAHSSVVIRRALPVLGMALLLAWPLRSVVLGLTDWQRQPMVKSDRWQFVSGWPAGLATRRAVDALRALADERPIAIVTNEVPGTPTDAVWVALDGYPGASVYFVDWWQEDPILQERGSDTFLLRRQFHHFETPAEPVRLPRGVPILFVCRGAYASQSEIVPTDQILLPLNPAARRITRYANPPSVEDLPPEEVVIYRLR